MSGKRVLRRDGATHTVKRRQRACRLRDGASKDDKAWGRRCLVPGRQQRSLPLGQGEVVPPGSKSGACMQMGSPETWESLPSPAKLSGRSTDDHGPGLPVDGVILLVEQNQPPTAGTRCRGRPEAVGRDRRCRRTSYDLRSRGSRPRRPGRGKGVPER